MLRIENTIRQDFPAVKQHLFSTGSIVDNSTKTGKVTAYFFPSMIFPNKVEFLSISLLYKFPSGIKDDKIIMFAVQKDPTKDPINLDPKYHLKHTFDNLLTELTFAPPVIINARQPFFFYHDGELKDSSVTVTYRNLD